MVEHRLLEILPGGALSPAGLDLVVEVPVKKWCFPQTFIFCIGNPIVNLRDFDVC